MPPDTPLPIVSHTPPTAATPGAVVSFTPPTPAAPGAVVSHTPPEADDPLPVVGVVHTPPVALLDGLLAHFDFEGLTFQPGFFVSGGATYTPDEFYQIWTTPADSSSFRRVETFWVFSLDGESNTEWSTTPSEVYPWNAGWPTLELIGTPPQLATVPDRMGQLWLNAAEAFVPPPRPAPGKLGSAIRLLQGDYLYGEWTRATPPNSISFWIKTENGTIASGDLLALGGGAADFMVGFPGDGSIGVESGGFSLGSATGSVNDGQWHLVVLTFREGHLHLFIDGEATSVAPFDTASLNGMTLFRVGQGLFNSALDELSIWDRPLTDDEIAALWNGGAGLPFGEF